MSIVLFDRQFTAVQDQTARSDKVQYLHKNFILILLLAYAFSILTAQVRTDFLLTDNATNPSMKLDASGNMHFIWGSEGFKYTRFDSNGIQTIAPYSLESNGSATMPNITISNTMIGVAWNVSQAMIWNYYTEHVVLDLKSEDSISLIDIIDPPWENVYSSTISFLDDTTLATISAGQYNNNEQDYQGVICQITTTTQPSIARELSISSYQYDAMIEPGAPATASQTSNQEFMVVWRANISGKQAVYGRIFADDGSPMDTSFMISAPEDISVNWFGPKIAVSNHNEYAVVWLALIDSVNYITKLRRYSSTGQPLGPIIQVSDINNPAFEPTCDIALDDDGNCLVAWEQEHQGQYRIYAQRYQPDFTRLGDNFRLSQEPVSIYLHWLPSVALHGGKIYACWAASAAAEQSVWAVITDFLNPALANGGGTDIQPKMFYLHPNYPNPFNPNTNLSYDLPATSNISLVVYDISGREIMEWTSVAPPGYHRQIWDGTNNIGRQVPSGIYLYRLVATSTESGERFVSSKKMLLIK